MPMFRSKAAENIETVRDRLAQANSTLVALEAERRELALEAALSDDPAAALHGINDKVVRQRTIVEGLQLALSRAEQLEAQRLAAAVDAAEKSRRNAIKAHARAAEKAAADLRAGLEQAVFAYRELLHAGAKIETLLKPHERQQVLGIAGLRNKLADLVQIEMARQGTPTNPSRLQVTVSRPPGADPSKYVPADIQRVGEEQFPLVPQARGNFGGQVPYGTHVTQTAPIDGRVRALFDLSALPAPPLQQPAPSVVALTEPAPSTVAEPRRVMPDPSWQTIPDEIVVAQATLADMDASPEARDRAEHLIANYGLAAKIGASVDLSGGE